MLDGMAGDLTAGTGYVQHEISHAKDGLDDARDGPLPDWVRKPPAGDGDYRRLSRPNQSIAYVPGHDVRFRREYALEPKNEGSYRDAVARGRIFHRIWACPESRHHGLDPGLRVGREEIGA